MDPTQILTQLSTAAPWIHLTLTALGTLVVIGQVIVPLTPTKKDDEAWDKIRSVPILGSVISALENFAVIRKK